MLLGNAIFCGNDISYFHGDYYEVFQNNCQFAIKRFGCFQLAANSKYLFGAGVCSLLF